MEENTTVTEAAEAAAPIDDTVPEEEAPIDYEGLIEEDLSILREEFPELEGIRDISELDDPMRYGALRDLGLTPAEAYRATARHNLRRADNRSHLRVSAPRAAGNGGGHIGYEEMRALREIFDGISDSEIQRLYKKVTR